MIRGNVKNISVKPGSPGRKTPATRANKDDFEQALKKLVDKDRRPAHSGKDFRQDSDSQEIRPLSNLQQGDKGFEPQSMMNVAMPTGVQLNDSINLASAAGAPGQVVDIEQFTSFMEQILRSEQALTGKWSFNLQHGALLSQIAVQQLTANQWSIQLGTSSNAQERLLNKNVDRLLKKLRASGKNIEVFFHRDTQDHAHRDTYTS